MSNKFFSIKNDFFRKLDDSIVKILLKDKSTKKNIIWATDHFSYFGKGYQLEDEILISAVKGYKAELVKPRVAKSKYIQAKRIKNKAEVFTPSWVCNSQNNSIDNDWFETENTFNFEIDKGWKTNFNKIKFPTNKTWFDYVDSRRLEITCGEAPYIASIYDSVNGDYIPIENRIGILDRKLRVINENVKDDDEWRKWVIRAFQSIYGYEYQGDNLLLARENIFYTFIEYYRNRFNEDPSLVEMREIANIISWNIWQMDGLKGVVPLSCKPSIKKKVIQLSLFPEDSEFNADEFDKEVIECPGCQFSGMRNHIGVYCKIKDWRAEKTILFVSTLRGGK